MTEKNQRSDLVTLPGDLIARGFSLRAEEIPGDDDFLIALYRSTREREFAMVPDWTEEDKQAFVMHQFTAQRHHYRNVLENCAFDVIMDGSMRVGRLYTQERQTQMHIIDIALVPERRNEGLGAKILTELHRQSSKVGKSLGIFVEQYNPAKHLYARLGFETVVDGGVYLEMDWPPASTA